jgi:sugar lactone lactonase YvrE
MSLGLLLALGCSNDPLIMNPPPDSGVMVPDSGAQMDAAPIEEDSGVETPDMGVVDPDTGVEPDAGELPMIDCTKTASLPASYNTIRGPIHAEDFAFDDQGNMVSGDEQGNLIKSDKRGNLRVWVPNATSGALAGMRYLPNGDLVFAGVDTGTLYRVAPNGATIPVVSGLDYPNGIEIDLDGMVYIAEQSAGVVRRVDPLTGAFDFVAEDMNNPNGVSFSPDYQILYVGSFGAGTIHAIDFDENRMPSEPRLFAMTPNAPGENGFPSYDDLIMACSGLSLGDPCTHPYYTNLGLSPTCIDDGFGSVLCYAEEEWPDFETPCIGLGPGDACEVPYQGMNYPGLCYDDFGFLYCQTDQPIGPGGTYGGLDGMGVDACGYVYVCEFVVGIVWRISPDGSQVEEVFHPPTEWIPNMQWGTGLGDWETNSLYVIDRTPDITYEVLLDTPGKPVPYPQRGN